jgi:hypothetical protein
VSVGSVICRIICHHSPDHKRCAADTPCLSPSHPAPQCCSRLFRPLCVHTCQCELQIVELSFAQIANMSEVSDSPLLRCLTQLNDEVWTEILLPKLLADGSAPAAALTCSRLRQLCQRSRQQLKLTSLGSADKATVRRWTEQLPQRFPACSFVVMKHCEQSCPAAPVIVGVLSRQEFGVLRAELVVWATEHCCGHISRMRYAVLLSEPLKYCLC